MQSQNLSQNCQKPVSQSRTSAQWSGLFIFALMLVVTPEFAYANPIENGINSVIAFINSGVIRGLGILAIFSLGIAAYLGKMGWDMALKIVTGVILTFGAAGIVDLISSWV